jgi:hypothetical protein
MIHSRSALAVILAAAVCAPAPAQIIEGRVLNAGLSLAPQIAPSAMGPQAAVGLPEIAALSAAVLPAPPAAALIAPQAAAALAAAPVPAQIPLSRIAFAAASVPTPAGIAAAASAPSAKISAAAGAIAPDLKALQAPDLKGEDAAAAGERIMASVLGKTPGSAPLAVFEPAAASPLKARPSKSRATPILTQVEYAEGVSEQLRILFQQTLTSRKPSWTRQLPAMGVKLEGRSAPVVTVRSAAVVAKGTAVDFTVEWNQGETHVGAFRTFVALLKPTPLLRRLPVPEPDKERQIRMVFKKTVVADGIETAVADASIASYLESKGLRLLSKDWEGRYNVSVTGQDKAGAVAREITGNGIVLYATPVSLSVPEANQIQIAFKEKSRDAIGALLREKGLSVLSIDRSGLYTVGAEGLAAADTAARLQAAAEVLYAKPVEFDPPVSSQMIVSLRETAVSEDDVSALFRRHGLTVFRILGDKVYYKVARADGAPAAESVAAVSREPIVKQALVLGGVSGTEIQSAAKSAASQKGRPWSQTEYSAALAMTYWRLEMRGATPEQLELFEKLCAAAPIRGGGFNPWSGD